MSYKSNTPDTDSASAVAAALLGEQVLEAKRLATGGQNFVFAIKTAANEYVIRMTFEKYKSTYNAAIYWQNKLLPLGVPLAKFIASDLDAKYSPFIALIMQRAPGNDLCNVYLNLSTAAKKSLAQQIVSIQHKVATLPLGITYGFTKSYEQPTEYKSWYAFLLARLDLCRESLKKTDAFPADTMTKVLAVATNLQDNFALVTAKPFMWDTSERNVMIDHDQISTIVDVDDMCFGDPLFTLGLTYVALEASGFDTVYTDTWASLLNLDPEAQLRLEFYRVFYTTWFMRHYADVSSDNGTAYNMDADVLNRMFQEALARIATFT